MPRHALPAFPLKSLAALALALTAAGCSSSRFGGMGPGGAAASVPPRGPSVVYNFPADVEPLPPAAPSGPITSEPLPPIGGTAPLGAPAPGGVASAPPPAGQVLDPAYNPQAPAVVASRPPEPPAAASPSANRLAAVGTWRAKDAAGGSCRVSLSSSPTLDLYRASATGCANKDLSKLTAWDNRDGEIYLYQAGGTVLARLRPGGEGYEGVLTKSSGSLSLSR